MAKEREKPAAPPHLCVTCLGAGKVITFILVDGSTRQVWTSCPACGAPQRIVPGP